MGRRLLVLVAVVVAAVSAANAAGAVTPATAAFTLGTADFPGGAVLLKQGTTPEAWLPKIAASSTYSRTFGSARLGEVELPSVTSAALVAKRKAEVGALMSSLQLVAHSQAGRQAFLAEVQKTMGPAAKKVVSTKVVRARTLAVGDAAVEFVFRFRTAASSFEVGEQWVRVGNALSVVLFLAAEPGLSAGQGTALAKVLADHLRLALAPAPTNEVRPTVSGVAQVGQTLAATPGVWSTSLATLAYQWLRCNQAMTACSPLPGATSATYVVAATDTGAKLVVAVTASTPAGSWTVRSLPTLPVA